MKISRYTSRIHLRIGREYKTMLSKLAAAANLSVSEQARAILEPAIRRRFVKFLKNNQKEAQH